MNTRTYRMTVRAEAAAATGERILTAAERLFSTLQYDQASLADIARDAGVTLQTVLRRFGSKERLFGTAAERVYARVAAQRGQTRPGDVPGAIRNLLDHYEEFGALAMHLLSQEGRVPLIAEATARGREFHAAWVERTLAPLARGLPAQARRRRMAMLVALTDVYVWKVLRQDRGLTRAATETALLETLRALTSGGA